MPNTKPIIIGVSGKKQSGKTTLCEYLNIWLDLYVNKTDNITISQRNDGNINFVHNKDNQLVDNELVNIIKQRALKLSKLYSFADPLKYLVCHKILGIPLDNLYGTDEQKNTLTPYLWDKMPYPIAFDYSDTWEDSCGESLSNEIVQTKVPRTHNMSAREVMQVVGTDMFRTFFSDDVWVNAAFRLIEDDEDEPHVAFITDVRFPSEVNSIIDNDGYIIRLERSIFKDAHVSETSLNDYDFQSLGEKSLVIDNHNLSICEKNKKVENWLKPIIDKYL